MINLCHCQKNVFKKRVKICVKKCHHLVILLATEQLGFLGVPQTTRWPLSLCGWNTCHGRRLSPSDVEIAPVLMAASCSPESPYTGQQSDGLQFSECVLLHLSPSIPTRTPISCHYEIVPRHFEAETAFTSLSNNDVESVKNIPIHN